MDEPISLADVERYLDQCEDELLHPNEVSRRLIRWGWEEWPATRVAERYRRRFDEHSLGYSAFLFTVGFTALSIGSVLHVLLNGLDGASVDADALSVWLTILVIAAPLAAWSWHWVVAVDDDDPAAAWSRPRRALARTLVWACGVVGGFRLLQYVFTLVSTVTGAGWADDLNPAVGLANVAVSTAITFPLGLWAFRFLHRFDAEDPTAPRRSSRRGGPATDVAG